MKINSAIIGVGSNINPEENIRRAEQEVASLASIIRKSGFVYTKPLLYESQDDFLNGVFQIETSLEYQELDNKLKEIENRLGRVRTENKNAPRTIDLDPVIFNNQVKDKDVFTRDFIKTPVLDFLPELYNTLNCLNYYKYFCEVKEVTEAILAALPVPPVSVFGAGHWFCCRGLPEGDVDFFVITENIDEYGNKMLRELRKSVPRTLASSPVRVRLLNRDEPEIRTVEESGNFLTGSHLNQFINNFSSHILLYGNPRPF